MSHLGSPRAEGELEDTGFANIPHLPTAHLDASRSTGDHTKWTNVYLGIYYLEEES